MKRVVLLSVVVMVGAVAGAYFYYTGRIEDRLADLARVARPTGEFSYDEVSISADGGVHIKGIRFEPRTMGQSVRIGRLSLRADNLWALWNLAGELDENRVPRELGIAIRGLAVPIRGAVSGQGERHSVPDFAAAGCGERRAFSAADIRAMGYDEFYADIDLHYRLTGGVDGIVLRSRTRLEEMAAVTAEARLQMRAPSRRQAAFVGGVTQARVRSARIDYTDLGFAQRVMALCTQETGLDRVAYIERHLRAWQAMWARLGLRAGPNFIAAYKGVFNGDGEASIRFAPSSPIAVMQLAAMPMEAAVRSLNARLYKGSEAIGALDLRPLRPGERASAAKKPGQTVAAPEPRDGGRSSPQQRGRVTMRDIEPSAAGRHEGSYAVIVMADGKEYTGRLEAVDSGLVRLRRRLSGGYAVIPLAIADIAALRVRR